MNERHKTISNPKDCSKISNSCYKYNEMGDYYFLESGNIIKYLFDDTTKFNNTYNLIKYDSGTNFTSHEDISTNEIKHKIRINNSFFFFF